MENRLHRYDLSRPRPRRGHRCSKYKKYLSMIMFKLSNTKAEF